MLDKTYSIDAVENPDKYQEWIKDLRSDPRSSKTVFAIMMPPPNVTGILHIGHALNMTLQDILIRYYRMAGYNAFWQPGTDHAGIATQMVLERQLDDQGLKKQDLGRSEFVRRLWRWKETSATHIRSQLYRLGVLADWERDRFTLDDGMNRAVNRVFVTLYRQGLIYKDQRLINWDPHLATAISDLEVDSKEVDGDLWYIRYPLRSGSWIVVATTRPETLLGDKGIAVHPEDSRYRELIGQKAILPLVEREIPIVGDPSVDVALGSGAVKITPAHDFDDFERGKRYDLEPLNIFDAAACLNHNAPLAYQGLDRFVARGRIIEDLRSLGLIEKREDHRHRVPHGDRSGVRLEPWLMEQWFCDAKRLAPRAIEAVDCGKTVFFPAQWKNTYFEWMNGIQPWCISRQLWWGHQIPAWYGPEGEIFVAESEEEALRQARETLQDSPSLTRDPDVLDTWFSSALWPFSTLGWPESTPYLQRYYPSSVLATSFDIIFFWVARMMMMGLHFMGDVPFRQVYIHALVRDEKGQKMSKSKGNIIDPMDLIEKYGCDSVRFTLASLAAPGRDLKLAEERVQGNRNFMTKLWNATRYALLNRCSWTPDFDPTSLSYPLNRWIAVEIAQARADFDRAIAEFRFDEASRIVYHLWWNTLCDWYLELAKPILSETVPSDHQEETRATLGWSLGHLLHLAHPFIPFVTEELWGYVRHPSASERLFLSHHAPLPSLEYDTTEIRWIIGLITQLRSLLSDLSVSQRRMIVQEREPIEKAYLETHRQAILRLTKLRALEYDPLASDTGIRVVFEGVRGVIPADRSEEKKRLRSQIEGLDRRLHQLQRKLGDPQFIDRAPEEVIRRHQESRSQIEQTLRSLQASFTALDDL